MECGATSSSGSPPRPALSPATTKAVTPDEPGSSDVRANTEYTSAKGAFEIHFFSPVSRHPSPSGAASRARAAASLPAPGSVRREGRYRPSLSYLRDPSSRHFLCAGLHDGVRAQALQSERGFGCGASLSEPLAQDAQLQGADIPLTRTAQRCWEQTRQEIVFRQGGEEVPVRLAGSSGDGQRSEVLGRDCARSSQQLL